MSIWKYPNKVRILGKGVCVQNHFSKKQALWSTVFISNICKKSIKHKKTAENVFKISKMQLRRYMISKFSEGDMPPDPHKTMVPTHWFIPIYAPAMAVEYICHISRRVRLANTIILNNLLNSFMTWTHS